MRARVRVGAVQGGKAAEDRRVRARRHPDHVAAAALTEGGAGGARAEKPRAAVRRA